MTKLPERLHFYASEAPRAQEARRRLVDLYGDADAAEAEAVVALGGDGTMLRALHERGGVSRPIFGMNCGKVGFLMNPYREEGLRERVGAARALRINPLRMRAEDVRGGVSESHAFNEVTVFRRIHFSTHIRIWVDDVVRLEELICDGVMVATPTGSSGYNYSAYGPILPLGCGLLALTPISPYRPRRWRSALLPSRACIRLEVLDPERRPAGATADFHDFEGVRSIEVREDRDVSVPLLFDPEEQLSERLLREQFSF
ncbi:MAG: NAD kinase [Alphaproteobacteria bacterium]|nr:NAD kinase [Alphaproteobacteria bacterium]MDA7983704.1 NAD kinase [Alphaproteobacteria bacterium]MDA7989239.1 NAD kinase [Alphaproteobacteria bacterium]MDA8010489.1 NAD kinase [Alphaproteobacteria bacterium]